MRYIQEMERFDEIALSYYKKYGISIGKNCKIAPTAKIGTLSMVTDVIDGVRVSRDGYSYENNAGIIIGDNVTIGDDAIINFGWREPTIIEDNVWIGNKSSVGHDCIMKENSVIVSFVVLGGHCILEDWVFIGPMCYVNPFVVIGRNSYIGPMSKVIKDVPPYSYGYGIPYRTTKINEG